MTAMQLLKYPHETLLRASLPVDILGPQRTEIVNFILEMKEFYESGLSWGRPVGLAAPQVGKNWRIFIADGEIYINPEILWKPSAAPLLCREGCYSLEKDRFDYGVHRAYAVTLRWQDINGETMEKRFNGYPAQVIQHEFDHLEGRLCNSNI